MTTKNRSIIKADNSNQANKTVSFPLSNLPKEIRQDEIYPRSPLSALGLLAQTSKQYETETAFLRLLPAAIHAAPEFLDDKGNETALASIAILKKHPDLLFRKKQVTDHFGRQIWASPYQLFLGAGDVWALKQVHKDILPDIADGETKAEAQFKEQFPNCPWPLPKDFSEEMLYDKRNKDQIEQIVKQLASVKQLIDVDPFNNNKPLDTTKLAVETLCKLFQPKPGEVIRSGLHFPLAIMQEVHKTYNALRGHWTFFSLAVIKPALDALSTVDEQCCQYGLRDLDMEKGPSRRCHSSYQHPLGQPLSLRFVNDKFRVAALVDPYDGEVLFATLGYFYCFNKNGVRGPLGVWAREHEAVRVDSFWEMAGVVATYREQKQRHMGAIMQPRAEQTTHRHDDQPMRCVIL